VQQVARLYRSAFPDLNLTITHLLADGDFLAVQVRESGTHLGSFAGVEPGGRYISWEWIGLYRVQAGQLIERWGLIETPAFWEQLRGT
jgi:predicted ester cyclase